LKTPDAIQPPRLAEWLVRVAVARSRYADALIGDLHEGFTDVASRSSTAAASRWYWKRAVSISGRFLPSRLRASRASNAAPTGDPGMMTFLSDLRFGFRTLRRAPSFTIAAIVALGPAYSHRIRSLEGGPVEAGPYRAIRHPAYAGTLKSAPSTRPGFFKQAVEGLPVKRDN